MVEIFPPTHRTFSDPTESLIFQNFVNIFGLLPFPVYTNEPKSAATKVTAAQNANSSGVRCFNVTI